MCIIQLLLRVNSLRIRFSNNYFRIIIFGMFKRVFIFREKRVRKKGRRRRRRRNTRGGGEQQALQAEHTTFPTTIKSFAASLPPCSYFGREKAVSRVSPIEIVLFDEPVLPFRCSVGLPMRACRLIRWSIGPCPFQPWYSFKNRRKLLINNSRLGGKKKIIIIVIIKK